MQQQQGKISDLEKSEKVVVQKIIQVIKEEEKVKKVNEVEDDKSS